MTANGKDLRLGGTGIHMNFPLADCLTPQRLECNVAAGTSNTT